MKKDSYRKERVANVLAHSLTKILHQKSAHFKFRDITISFIKMSNDLRIANIYCRCLVDGQDMDESEFIKDLNQKSGFIRHHLAPLLYLKFLPELRFHYDHIPEEELHFRNVLDSIRSE